MLPEQPGEFDDFIDDDEPSSPDDDAVPGTPAHCASEPDEAESPLGSQGDQYRYVPDTCTAIDFDEEGNEVVCGNPKNPAEQLCHSCKVGFRF